ncbi:ABC transporter permease [Lysinibacillus piscis]|uniref:Putative hemin transport system permease protein HrtB n=1 Tax=Lysinibacillus piscis TaxID=2518931 RepID=A0ABQ5NNH1_9BACI|nr:ABC transporter permease [Lysinibacillus sp. KH24]GLC89922.1 ABC transporter permease [Lysinibacillus sp. KH24]
MNLAWKDMKKNKVRFFIVGSIIFLVSFLTFIISGLANGLSQDNAALIKDLPKGYFYMNADADKTYNLSKIDNETQQHILQNEEGAVAFSIQMGFLNDQANKQHSVAFVTATDSEFFAQVKQGEVLLDSSLQDKGIHIGDSLTNNQLEEQLVVKGFVEQKKFSHAPVAYIHQEDYTHMYRVQEMQLVFIPNTDVKEFTGLQAFSQKEFLQTIPSYNAEQLSLNMIIWFLVVISGLLFAIFFYMMNVQKIGLYGILKAIGVKTIKLFKMIWTQMLILSSIALALSIGLSQMFSLLAPNSMPFHLTIPAMLQLAIVFLVIGFVGATISGLQIKKIEPLQAIQRGEA